MVYYRIVCYLFFLLLIYIMLCIIVAWLVCLLFFGLFFFFKQKTAYEMRISDWSSDVCSSDLLLALHHAGIAGQEAAALQHRAQARLVERQRLGDAVAHRARLTGEAAALHRADDVELIAAVGDQERLGEDHAQHRPGEVDRLVLAVHGDLAGARLDPDAGHGVLALAGGVGAALRVALRLGGGSLGLRGHARGSSQLTQIAQGLSLVGHAYWLLLFFGFIASRSSTCGCCASWGCSAPA